MKEASLQALIERLQVLFQDHALLQTALTHRSYSHESNQDEENNERLEFLGDALLSAIVADHLICTFPAMREGQLTRMRAEIVRSETLAELARSCDLGTLLRMGIGEEANGGRQRQSILAGTFEALLGALYLDQGMDAVREFLIPLIQPLLPTAKRVSEYKDARSRLQEWAQAAHGKTPQYRTISHSGPMHDAEFLVEVRIARDSSALGRGRSKQAAAQQAAHTLLSLIAPELVTE